MNPLIVRASASTKEGADPGYAVIQKLIENITSVATTVSPSLAQTSKAAPEAATGKGGEKPPACSDPKGTLDALSNDLFSDATKADTLTTDFKNWTDAITNTFKTGTGPEAIMAGVEAITKSANQIDTKVKSATILAAQIDKCADDAPDTYKQSYELARATRPEDRIDQLKNLVAAEKKLAETLKQDYAANEQKWIGPNKTYFEIGDQIDATWEKLQTVTLKIVKVSSTSSSNTLSVEESNAASVSFVVRRYSSLVPEIGVGAVFSTIREPVYGTGQNAAGQTIVAKKQDKSLAISPTVLANFVCRCGTGLLSPMAQVGVAASKDTPAILLGGGIRLFGLGKGDVAVGGGAAFTWVKDLQKLKVGDAVTGTNDINSDLGFSGTPRVAGYFAIQYKF